jgi:hypothetical protein
LYVLVGATVLGQDADWLFEDAPHVAGDLQLARRARREPTELQHVIIAALQSFILVLKTIS